MFKYKQITDVLGRGILDGRGLPAIEVEVLSENGEIGRAAVSLELPEEHMEEMAESIVLFVNTTMADMMIGENLLAQNHMDQILERMTFASGEQSVRRYAARVISCAVARTAAESLGIPLYQYLGGIQVQSCPEVRICLPEGKEPELHCRSLFEKWKSGYCHTSICLEGQKHLSEKKMDASQYITVSQCLNEIRIWKKEGKERIVLKDTGFVTDAFLVDLAVAAGVDILELRPPVRGENTVKYTQIMRIQEHL